MNFEQEWLEYDYNPFVVFDKNEKVKSLNVAAQYLLADVHTKELYNVALAYATHSFGFKTTMIDLVFKSHKFYGITVGYTNEESIGIKLYKKPEKKFQKPSEDNTLVNVYSVLDMCISAVATSSDTIYIKDLDPTFPEIKLPIEGFVKIITYILNQITIQEKVLVKMHIKLGEYLKVEGKKYTIFSLEFSCDLGDIPINEAIYALADKINCTITKEKGVVSIGSPLVY